jgi:hypothetical protein
MQQHEKNQHSSADAKSSYWFVLIRNLGEKCRQMRHQVSPISRSTSNSPTNQMLIFVDEILENGRCELYCYF